MCVKGWIYKGEAPTSRAGREAQQAALRAAAQQRTQRPREAQSSGRRRRGAETAGASAGSGEEG